MDLFSFMYLLGIGRKQRQEPPREVFDGRLRTQLPLLPKTVQNVTGEQGSKVTQVPANTRVVQCACALRNRSNLDRAKQ